MSELKKQSQRSRQIVTLVLNTNPADGVPTKEFNQMLNVTINNPSGFYVRQIACNSSRQVTSVEQKGGDIGDAGEGTISYPLNTAGVYLFNIYTDLVNNYIGTITTGSTVCPGTFFELTKDNIHDTFLFRIDDIDKPSIEPSNTFVLVLEFVKF